MVYHDSSWHPTPSPSFPLLPEEVRKFILYLLPTVESEGLVVDIAVSYWLPNIVPDVVKSNVIIIHPLLNELHVITAVDKNSVTLLTEDVDHPPRILQRMAGNVYPLLCITDNVIEVDSDGTQDNASSKVLLVNEIMSGFVLARLPATFRTSIPFSAIQSRSWSGVGLSIQGFFASAQNEMVNPQPGAVILPNRTVPSASRTFLFVLGG